MGSWLGRGLAGICGLALLLGAAASTARADVLSDQPAAILVVPKIVVDTERSIDTLIQISNASNSALILKCYYVNATPVCGNGEGNCIPGQRFADLPPCVPSTACVQQWQETDFRVVLTKNQPVAWLASQGAVDCRRTPNGITPDLDDNIPCFPLDGIFRVGEAGQSNLGSSVPPVAQDPFIGELKCIAVDDNGEPVPRNDAYGHVTIVGTQSTETLFDMSGFNIVGIQAMEENNHDNTLVLGRAGDEGVEYNGCPNILILDHFFDFAVDPVTGDPVVTDLTLVPCSEDFEHQQPVVSTVQFLVFNEFEQRFSTSRRVDCYREIQLSNIDTATNDRSIFSAQVAGTLTGQTRIRGVVGTDPAYGNTLIGVAEEFRAGGTAAFNLHAQGVRPQKDYIYLTQ